MNEKGDAKEENLGTRQKGIEEAAGKVPHTTKHERGKVKPNAGEGEKK